jgi:hypothetical protein
LSESQKQAVQRFVGVLIAEAITIALAVLQSADLRALIIEFGGEGSLITTGLLALLPPIIAAVSKLAAGPTQKASVTEGRRGLARGERPGIFG